MFCPNCESDNVDFLVNDDLVCSDCRYRWTADLGDDNAQTPED